MKSKSSKAPATLPSHLEDAWSDAAAQLREGAPPAAIEAMARQIHLLRDAERRIHEDGAVVVDGKGNAVEHPAIRIQREAAAEIRSWLKAYERRRCGLA